LLEIVEATSLASFALGHGKDRQEHGREDGDDRNNHQQLE
jgi:hypothetical protein